MNNRLINYIATLLLFISCSAALQVSGQVNVSANRGTDSLEINKIIKIVLDQHPSIQEAQEAVKAARCKNYACQNSL